MFRAGGGGRLAGRGQHARPEPKPKARGIGMVPERRQGSGAE